MKRADELIPWKVTDISLRPFKQMWCLNPSIHFDGQLWRCTIRCADYALPAGREIRSAKAKPGQSRTKNAMVIFDPSSWKPVELYKIKEHDNLPRVSASSIGYEDIRLFRTDRYGLQGIAAALHLRRADRLDPRAEQVLLWFDEEYNVVEARPIRGTGSTWSTTAQKNWAPFDHCAEPRFLYAINNAIDKGTPAPARLFDDRGEILDARDAQVRLSTRPRRSFGPDAQAVLDAQERARDAEREREREYRRRAEHRSPRGGDDTALSDVPADVQDANYVGLRGGSQLVRVGDDAWLGIGHTMRFVDGLKLYWHVFYLTDSRGTIKAASAPMKLAPNKIEFAAGLAIDGDRVVISFGVDDMEAKIGETSLAAVLAMSQPIGAL